MNAYTRRTASALLIALNLAFAAGAAESPQAGATPHGQLLDATTPWRVHCMSGPELRREKGNVMVWGRSGNGVFDPDKHGLTPPPPEDWIRPSFDDSRWVPQECKSTPLMGKGTDLSRIPVTFNKDNTSDVGEIAVEPGGAADHGMERPARVPQAARLSQVDREQLG